jgi:NAD dependent epimerase/dehydratase family enzyme
VVHLRIPPVLGGRALKQPGFQAGDGQQWASWVGLDELASIIEFTLKTDTLAGAVNAVSPNPLRNREFATVSTQTLGQKAGRVMPALIVRMIMGEMGEELILASRRMQPAKLLDAGYTFRYPDLGEAVRHEQGKVQA